MVERARLESVCTATYRGFKSLPHRQYKQRIERNQRPIRKRILQIRARKRVRLTRAAS